MVRYYFNNKSITPQNLLFQKGLLKIVPVYEKEELIPNLLMPLLNVKYTKDDFDAFIQKLHDEILR